jgi:anti-sigma-K factor RskA
MASGWQVTLTVEDRETGSTKIFEASTGSTDEKMLELCLSEINENALAYCVYDGAAENLGIVRGPRSPRRFSEV